jgi:putative transposase
VVRELRDHVTQRGFRSRQITVVTTLINAKRYPCTDLAERYRKRWDADTHRAQLKTTMKRDVLPCQTVLGVQKELLVFASLDNLVCLVILPSAKPQQVDVARISFLAALRWLGAPDTGVPLEILRVNPARPNRVAPRVTKRRPKAFPFMSKPRRIFRQASMQHTLGA